MEATLRKSFHGGLVKEEKMNNKSTSSDEDQGCPEDYINVVKVGNERRVHDNDINSKSPQHMDLTSDKEEDQIESTRAHMEEVMEENQRLRIHLDRIMKDYRNLRMKFHDIQKDAEKSKTNTFNARSECDEAEFVSLSLGRTSSDTKKEELSKILRKDDNMEEENHKGGLTLGLGCKFETPYAKAPKETSSANHSSENSLGEVKDEKATEETLPPNRILKTMRNEENDVLTQSPAKRAKVSIRVRCDTPTMNDGCQWRKYGQKIAKGNPCPRAYYRCTVAPSCPVRKQVQRCIQDMSILIITYEGTHNHPLPVSATAMAFTTSAAASMLLSGSNNSSNNNNLQAATTNTFTNINGLNFHLSDNNNNNTSKPNQFYLPNSSTSQHPTITLDLTSSTSSPQNNRITSNYPSTNLNFSYGNQQNSLNFATRPHQENISNIFKTYTDLQNNSLKTTQQSLLPQDYTIAAATKAITSDPKFQSALAVALTSIIGTGSGNKEEKYSSSQNVKVTEPFPVLCSFPSTSATDEKDYTF